jgi:hypothetical protein
LTKDIKYERSSDTLIAINYHLDSNNQSKIRVNPLYNISNAVTINPSTQQKGIKNDYTYLGRFMGN